MSDAIDAVAKALALQKQLAASRLVRMDELDAEIARLGRAMAELGNEAMTREVDARIAAAVAERSVAEQELRAALAEIDALRKMGRDSATVEARATLQVASGEPILRTPEETALDNVRAHLGDLDARLRLGDELGADTALGPPRARAVADPDTEARSEFEALRRKLLEERGTSAGGDASAPPKKTF